MRLNDTLTLARLRADVQAHRVRPIRLRSGLTQAEMATEIEVSPSAIAQWEAGRRVPRGKAALRYAALLQELANLDRSTWAATAKDGPEAA